VQDVPRIPFRDARNQRTDVGYGRFQRTPHGQDRRFSGLRTAATRHACWRTRAVILTRLLVTRAGLCNDQGVGAGGAKRQQRDDDGEGEPPHLLILAFARLRSCRPGPLAMSVTTVSLLAVQETAAYF
jgi:hypothetical protein